MKRSKKRIIKDYISMKGSINVMFINKEENLILQRN